MEVLRINNFKSQEKTENVKIRTELNRLYSKVGKIRIIKEIINKTWFGNYLQYRYVNIKPNTLL